MQTTIAVATPSCTVPDPVGDAATWSGAIIALWIAAYLGHYMISLFRNPQSDAY